MRVRPLTSSHAAKNLRDLESVRPGMWLFSSLPLRSCKPRVVSVSADVPEYRLHRPILPFSVFLSPLLNVASLARLADSLAETRICFREERRDTLRIVFRPETYSRKIPLEKCRNGTNFVVLLPTGDGKVPKLEMSSIPAHLSMDATVDLELP